MANQDSKTKKGDWMVIGYSTIEGEYPVALHVTEAEARRIADKNNAAAKRYLGGSPRRPEEARPMGTIEKTRS